MGYSVTFIADQLGNDGTQGDPGRFAVTQSAQADAHRLMNSLHYPSSSFATSVHAQRPDGSMIPTVALVAGALHGHSQ